MSTWLCSLGEKISENICVVELNKNLLNSTTNIFIKHVYVQVYYCEYITFKSAANTFECMEISVLIYEGVIEPSHLKKRIG